MTRLHTWLSRARNGVRQMVFVTGEAGLGKTTLVEAFVAELGNHGPCGSGTGSAWSTTVLGKPTCRCWRRWDACVEEQADKRW